jgi:hypothetical protein
MLFTLRYDIFICRNNFVELAKDEAIKTISASTTENKVDADKRIKELKNQQDLELNFFVLFLEYFAFSCL